MDNLSKWLEYQNIIDSWEYEIIDLDNEELEELQLINEE